MPENRKGHMKSIWFQLINSKAEVVLWCEDCEKHNQSYVYQEILDKQDTSGMTLSNHLHNISVEAKEKSETLSFNNRELVFKKQGHSLLKRGRKKETHQAIPMPIADMLSRNKMNKALTPIVIFTVAIIRKVR